MKYKIGLAFLVVVLGVEYGEEAQALSFNRARIENAVADLQSKELTLDSVKQFQDKIEQQINMLDEELRTGDPLGRIGTQIAINRDLIDLVRLLYDYSKGPTDEKAVYLRGLALSDGKIRGLVRHFMDEQKDSRFKF